MDGIRCVAVLKDGVATLWTRTRKPINSMPHIVKAIEETFDEDVVLDGELFHSDYMDDFNKIISLVRPDEPVEGHEIVQYHVFDCVDSQPFESRVKALQKIGFEEPLVSVPQSWVEDEDAAMELTNLYVAQGYEGGMIKNAQSPYEHKRSYHIQKIKFMQDAEFKVVDAEEGRGKLAGHVGSFVCLTEAGLRFNVKLKGELERLKFLWENPGEWRGKSLTVQFQNYTPDRIPRFPIGVALRTYE